MLILVGIAIAALPFLIATIRNVGWIASVLVILSTVCVALTAVVGEWGLAAVPWVVALLAACGATSGREIADKKRHAELIATLRGVPDSSDKIDAFLRETKKR